MHQMVDSNNGNDAGNKGKADGNKDKETDTVGALSDGLLRLVEEDDGKGNVSYSVETVSDDELVYSSVSKAQAFSFVEGYRAANGKGEAKTRKPKEDDASNDKSGTPAPIDPSKIKRKRSVL
jgi:hypothetical protein